MQKSGPARRQGSLRLDYPPSLNFDRKSRTHNGVVTDLAPERKRYLTLMFVGLGLTVLAVVLAVVGVLTHFVALIVFAGVVFLALLAFGEVHRRMGRQLAARSRAVE